MSISTNNTIARIAALVAGFGLVAMSFAYAMPASAQVADVCPNIAGDQETVPGGYTLNSTTGDCDAVQTAHRSGGYTLMPIYFFNEIGIKTTPELASAVWSLKLKDGTFVKDFVIKYWAAHYKGQ